MDVKSFDRCSNAARCVSVVPFLDDSMSSGISKSARRPCMLAVIPIQAIDGDFSAPLSCQLMSNALLEARSPCCLSGRRHSSMSQLMIIWIIQLAISAATSAPADTTSILCLQSCINCHTANIATIVDLACERCACIIPRRVSDCRKFPISICNCVH